MHVRDTEVEGSFVVDEEYVKFGSSIGLGMVMEAKSVVNVAADAAEAETWAAAQASSVNAAPGTKPRPLTRWSCRYTSVLDV